MVTVTATSNSDPVCVQISRRCDVMVGHNPNWALSRRAWIAPLIPPRGLTGPDRDRLNALGTRQNGRHFADDISKYICINSWGFFQWRFSDSGQNFFEIFRRVRLATSQYGLRWWLSAEHYLSQCWLNSLTHICVSRFNGLTRLNFRYPWPGA